MNLQTTYSRVLCLHAAAKRLQIPERTLRYQASRGWIQGAFKQGKLWKFSLSAIEKAQPRRLTAIALIGLATVCLPPPVQAADLRLAKYQGKVVPLNFRATWRHGCKLEIPRFMEFQKKYKRSGFTVIGVAMDEEGWKAVKPYVKDKKINYPIVVGDDGLAKQYGLSEMPMTLLIGRDGKVVKSHSGMVDRDACEGEIRTLLQDRARQHIANHHTAHQALPSITRLAPLPGESRSRYGDGTAGADQRVDLAVGGRGRALGVGLRIEIGGGVGIRGRLI